jgi:1-acyl-sn-glycerol-3-phosphate acyltransferase
MVRQRIARVLVRAAGWRMVGDVPRVGVVVGAPHTSNWDYVAMLMVMWHGGVPPRVLVKKELFRGPLGWFLRATGGIPLDRRNPAGVVRELVVEAHGDKPFLLILAAEGTREKGKYWKSGFYRIAEQTGLPIAMAFVDGPTKTAGFGPTFTPSGDIGADMDLVRAFYADKQGIHPAQRTEPRLREEGARPDGA